jgi:hypothetical protein
MSKKQAAANFRKATQAEQALLRRLLEMGDETAQQFLEQVEGICVRSSCTCGCPSISLLVAIEGLTAPANKRIIVDDVFGYSAGKLIGLIVFAENGKLAGTRSV